MFATRTSLVTFATIGLASAVIAAGVARSSDSESFIDSATFSSSQPMATSMQGQPGCGLPANNWHLNGNRNSNPEHNFLGTGDFTDLVVRTDCTERIRILATGETIIHHDLHVGEDLSVDGNTLLNDLEVSNDLTVHGDLSVLGHTAIMTLNAADNATFGQNVTVSGQTTLGLLNVQNAASFLSNISVQGQSTFNGFASFGAATSFSGPATFASNATFQMDANVAGDMNVAGTTRTGVLEILGADLAEEFPFSEPVQPGMVVEIDMNNAGHLRPASGAYNRRVAGIVAGANEFSTGVVLGRGSGNEFAAPVALSGRVYVYVDATERAVEVGDMLTTSERPGFAMAVRDFSRMHGAVIGKAMTAMPEGETGLVLVLVNLQ